MGAQTPNGQHSVHFDGYFHGTLSIMLKLISATLLAQPARMRGCKSEESG
jgi:hypothetical protein